jgi:hypothetical protein
MIGNLITIASKPSQPWEATHASRNEQSRSGPGPAAQPFDSSRRRHPMSQDIKSAVSQATLRLLRPLARFLLEARIGIGEFNALARLAYVQAAVQSAAGGGYRVNVSRIAALTGLTRVEVAALLAEERGAPPREHRGRVRAERVLHGWWNDPEFQDRSGAPEHLKRKGPKHSFAALVKRYSGDAHNAAAILDELLHSQAVRERQDGTLEALSRTCANVSWDSRGIEAVGEELAEHFETLLYNLKNPDQPRFARRVVCAYLDAYAARVVIPELAEQAEIFLEGAQDVLTRPKSGAGSKQRPPNGLKVAVALQFFQEPAQTPAASSGRSRSNRAPRPSRRASKKSSRTTGGL